MSTAWLSASKTTAYIIKRRFVAGSSDVSPRSTSRDGSTSAEGARCRQHPSPQRISTIDQNRGAAELVAHEQKAPTAEWEHASFAFLPLTLHSMLRATKTDEPLEGGIGGRGREGDNGVGSVMEDSSIVTASNPAGGSPAASYLVIRASSGVLVVCSRIRASRG